MSLRIVDLALTPETFSDKSMVLLSKPTRRFPEARLSPRVINPYFFFQRGANGQ